MGAYRSAIALVAVALSVLPPLGATGCGKSMVDVPLAWYPGDLDSALAAAKARNEPLFLYFGADWDTAAKEIEHETLVDPEVRLLLGRDFVPVHIDMTDDEDARTRDAARRFGVVGDPTMLVIAPDGHTQLARHNEFVPPRTLVRTLRFALAQNAPCTPRNASARWCIR